MHTVLKSKTKAKTIEIQKQNKSYPFFYCSCNQLTNGGILEASDGGMISKVGRSSVQVVNLNSPLVENRCSFLHYQ